MRKMIFATIVVTMALESFATAATYVNGISSELAWYSPKFIQVSTGSLPSGIYWYDEQQGLGSPFQAYADGALFGGSFTLGVVSLDSNPASSITISSNTGTVSAPFGSSHTRNIAYLGLDQDAEILYWVRSGASTTFLGSYFGRFDDSNPLFTSISINTAGLNGQLDSTFDFHRPDRNYDVSIFVRESNTAAPRVIPEPSTAMILTIGVFGLVFTRTQDSRSRTRRRDTATPTSRPVVNLTRNMNLHPRSTPAPASGVACSWTLAQKDDSQNPLPFSPDLVTRWVR